MNTAATTTRRISSSARATGNVPKSSTTMTNDMRGLKTLGTNLRYSIEGNELVIRVNIKERHGPSGSGKTTIVATSSGNQKIEGTDVIIGFNAYTKP